MIRRASLRQRCLFCLAATVIFASSAAAIDVKPAADAKQKNAAKQKTAAASEESRSSQDHEAASYWKSGLVKIDDRWLTSDEACQHFASLDAVRQYPRLRDAARWNLNDQLKLAQWCRDHGLEPSARFHFQLALRINPKSKDAQLALGMRDFQGAMLTEDQIREVKSLANARAEAIKSWRPKLLTLKRKLHSHTPSVREAAMAELTAISDPNAAPALEAIICPLSAELAVKSIAIISKCSSQQATEALVRQAVLSPYPEARKAIAEQLMTRSFYNWVPQMLGLMQAPVEVHALLSHDIDPSFSVAIWRHGPFADELVGFNQQDHPVAVDRINNIPIPVRDRSQLQKNPIYEGESGRTIQSPTPNLALAQQTMAAAAVHNQQAAILNTRIAETLAMVTEQPADPDAGTWYRWWYDYNDYPYPAEQQIYTDVARYTTTSQATNTISLGNTYLAPPPRPHSCFFGGTPVITWIGPRPIESIGIGDFVLSQSSETGELAFKPVIATTRGPETLMLKIVASGENLHLTRGHPLWLRGDGWRMAKELEVGDELYTLDGSVTVESISEWTKVPTFNLIVGQFNTYFVTSKKILAHDITLRRPTDNILPGVAPGHPDRGAVVAQTADR